jgi:hypothetical protein
VRFNAVCLNVRYFCGEGGRRVSMIRSLSREFSERRRNLTCAREGVKTWPKGMACFTIKSTQAQRLT